MPSYWCLTGMFFLITQQAHPRGEVVRPNFEHHRKRKKITVNLFLTQLKDEKFERTEYMDDCFMTVSLNVPQQTLTKL
jgi:hypothetical protein